MKNLLARALVETARRDARVVLLPEAAAEQALDLARAGWRPIVSGLQPRAALDVLARADSSLVVVSHGEEERPPVEDVAVLRSVPHLTILSPADAHELTACLALLRDCLGPVYLRLGSLTSKPIHEEPPVIRPGRFVPVQPGQGQLAWLATGSMVRTALAVTRRWRGSAVWSAPCLRPIAREAIATLCRRYRAVIVLEDHSIHGGLGTAVAEIAAEHGPGWVCRIGVRDPGTAVSAATADWLRAHELDETGVTTRVVEFLRRLPRAAA